MSTSESCVFLPSYVLDSVDDQSSKLDPDIFLSRATSTQLLETILAFYPHFTFTKKAQDDHELLRNIFLEMVAPHFNNLSIPSQSKTKYVQAPLLRFPSCLVQEHPKTVDSSSDINLERTTMFNIYGLSNLKCGHYRHAAEGLKTFMKTYLFLNEDEVSAIAMAKVCADDNLNDSVSYLAHTHESIESIQLHLSHSEISSTKRNDLENQLKSAITVLRCRQKTFDRAVQDVGFLSALTEYHEGILKQNTPNTPKASTQDTKEETQEAAQKASAASPK